MDDLLSINMLFLRKCSVDVAGWYKKKTFCIVFVPRKHGREQLGSSLSAK